MELFKIFLFLTLSLVMILAAVIAILSKGMPLAILSAGVISLLTSIIFLVLASPDVAMTEAAIGAGLTTFLFFVILRKTEQNSHKDEK